MKKTTKALIFSFLLASAAGVLLHGLYGWLPNPVFALLSPVRESIWEHVKILFYPFLAASLVLTRGGEKGTRAPWLLSLAVICLLLLVLSYVYHVTLAGTNFLFDLALYFALMALGFLLPRLLWPLMEWPGVERAAAAVALVLFGLIVWFAFCPPEGPLFADMESIRTFFTIPV